MNYKDATKRLRQQGCEFRRQGARHEVWYSPMTGRLFTMPRHGSKEIGTELLKQIEKQSGVKF